MCVCGVLCVFLFHFKLDKLFEPRPRNDTTSSREATHTLLSVKRQRTHATTPLTMPNEKNSD